jgi:hypothetical protein
MTQLYPKRIQKQPANKMSVITVAAGNNILPLAVSRAQAGDELVLDDGTHSYPAEIEIKPDGVKLRAANIGKARIRYNGRTTAGPDQQNAVKVTGKNVTIAGIQFAVAGAKAIGVAAHADNFTAEDLIFDGANIDATWEDDRVNPKVVRHTLCGGYWGIQLQRVMHPTLRRLTFGQMGAYGILLDSEDAGLRPDGTHNLFGCEDGLIEDLIFVNKSLWQHNIRAIAAKRFRVNGGRYVAPTTGPGTKYNGGLTLREQCEDWTITGTPAKPCYLDNPGVGGKNPDETVARNIRFVGCTIGGKVNTYKTDGVYVDNHRIDAAPPTPLTAQQQAAKLGAEIKALVPGMPAAAAAKVDQLVGMAK